MKIGEKTIIQIFCKLHEYFGKKLYFFGKGVLYFWKKSVEFLKKIKFAFEKKN